MSLGGVVHRYVELWEHIRTTVDTSVTTHQHTLARNLLRTYQHGEVLAVLHLVHHALEVYGIGAGVLETHHLVQLGNALHRVGGKAHLHVAGHVIQEYGQGQLRHQLFVELCQLGLSCGEVVGWGTDDAVCAIVGSLPGQAYALFYRGVGDTGQQGQSTAVDAARLLDHLLADIVAEALLLARRTQYEQAVNATCNEVFYQSFQTFNVQCLVVLQWGYQWWNNTTQGLLECCFHCCSRFLLVFLFTFKTANSTFCHHWQVFSPTSGTALINLLTIVNR